MPEPPETELEGASDPSLKQAPDAEVAAAEQEESLARIERGGITLAAERRLSELREHGGLFTSDLSINGWALCHQLGLRPLSQVMGSSIYQMGYQSSWGQAATTPSAARSCSSSTRSRRRSTRCAREHSDDSPRRPSTSVPTLSWKWRRAQAKATWKRGRGSRSNTPSSAPP